MEIVKNSDKTFKCPRCGTEVRINKISDVHYGIISSEVGFLTGLKYNYGDYLICPTCCAKIVLE